MDNRHYPRNVLTRHSLVLAQPGFGLSTRSRADLRPLDDSHGVSMLRRTVSAPKAAQQSVGYAYALGRCFLGTRSHRRLRCHVDTTNERLSFAVDQFTGSGQVWPPACRIQHRLERWLHHRHRSRSRRVARLIRCQASSLQNTPLPHRGTLLVPSGGSKVMSAATPLTH